MNSLRELDVRLLPHSSLLTLENGHTLFVHGVPFASTYSAGALRYTFPLHPVDEGSKKSTGTGPVPANRAVSRPWGKENAVPLVDPITPALAPSTRVL